MHKEKQKLCRFFVGPSLLSMADKETWGMLTRNDKTIGRKLAPGANADKRQRYCQSKGAIHTEGSKFQSYAYNRQDVAVQEQYIAEMQIGQLLILIQQ